MNSEALVSIIIATYNRAHVLPRAIQSVLSQTYKKIELIIVDDGSTDDTEQIVKRFNDSRIRYVCHASNRGIGPGKNTGIRMSQGEFIGFLDDDDEYFPVKIERSLDIFNAVPHRVGMVASNHNIISDTGIRIRKVDANNLRRIFPVICTWVVRKIVFEHIGLFDERMTISQDVDFFKRFRKKYKFHFIKEPLVNVHVSKDGCHVDPEKQRRLREKCLENLSGDKKIYAEHLKYLGKDLRAMGKTKEARACYWKAFCSYPLQLRYLFKYISSYFQKA
jgi:glycosyltransferase involved in cell wall biosynthesis